jgi:hypothetical protein
VISYSASYYRDDDIIPSIIIRRESLRAISSLYLLSFIFPPSSCRAAVSASGTRLRACLHLAQPRNMTKEGRDRDCRSGEGAGDRASDGGGGGGAGNAFGIGGFVVAGGAPRWFEPPAGEFYLTHPPPPPPHREWQRAAMASSSSSLSHPTIMATWNVAWCQYPPGTTANNPRSSRPTRPPARGHTSAESSAREA